MTTHSNQKSEPLVNSYASHFQIALSNWYLLQMEQIKKRHKRHKP